MKKIFWLLALSLTAAGAVSAADHAYAKMATPQDLMAGAVKPNMDKLAEMRKGGGPKAVDDWKAANASASVIGEVNQLMLLDGRIKDQVWEDGATKVIEAAKATMTAAMRQDMEGFNAGLDGMNQGCRTCHKVHKPKK